MGVRMSSRNHGSTRDVGLAGAIAAALGATACCVGPLVLSIAGVSSSALLVAFVPYRPWFIGASVVALAAGFWLTYRSPAAVLRTTNLADGPACDCEMPRAARAGRFSLWISTVVVALLVASPSLLAQGDDARSYDVASALALGLGVVSIPVDGMTCGSCERIVENVLSHSPGVVEASADARAGRAVVTFRPSETELERLAKIVARAGYRVGVPRSLAPTTDGRGG
jgi:mercuric ion transport protein